MREHTTDNERQVVTLVVGRDNDDGVHERSARAATKAAAHTIMVGSSTGILNRSWGKNRRPAITTDAAASSSAVGRIGLFHSGRTPAIANGNSRRYDAT